MSEILCRNVERGGRIGSAELDFMGEMLGFEISDTKSLVHGRISSPIGVRGSREFQACRSWQVGDRREYLEIGVDYMAYLIQCIVK